MKWINRQPNGGLKFNNALILPNLTAIWQELESINLADIATLDLADVSQIDSAGIALLLNVQQRCSTCLELSHAPASLKTLLGLYNLTEMLPIAEETA